MMNYSILKLEELKRLLPIKERKRDMAEDRIIYFELQRDIIEINKVIKQKENE